MVLNTNFKTADLLLFCAIMIVSVRAFGVQRTADQCKFCHISFMIFNVSAVLNFIFITSLFRLIEIIS